jgi:hypothetical protein
MGAFLHGPCDLSVRLFQCLVYEAAEQEYLHGREKIIPYQWLVYANNLASSGR